MDFTVKFKDAKRFIDEGRAKDACGALRPVLEKHLQLLCEKIGIKPYSNNIIGFIYALADAGAINRVQKSKFLNWLELGNAGSHSGDEEITHIDATYFLEGLAIAVGVILKQDAEEAPKPSVTIRRSRPQALIAAFYLSKFEHDKLRLGNQGETFSKIADALSIKKNTLKNYRDYFDPHTGSHRKGWWQVELSPQFAITLQKCKDFEEPRLRKMVLSFIDQ